MRNARLASALAIVSILAFAASTRAVRGLKNEERDQTRVDFKLIWSRPAGEKMISEEEGFPPPQIKQELERKDVPEADKEWLLNVLRVTAARKERVLYTDDGRTIDLPRDIGLLRWGIVSSKNFRYFMLWPWRSWASEGKSRMESMARLKPPDPQYFYWGAEKVEQARRGLEEYERLEKESDFILMDWKGNELWRRHSMRERIYISDDGMTVVATDGGHYSFGASFYGEKGELIREAEFPYGSGGNADLSADGSLFVVIAGFGSEDGYSTLIGYGKTGNRLWERKVRGKPHYGGTTKVVCVSNDGSYTAASVGDKTYLLDGRGNLVGWLDISDARSQVFSTDGSYLLLLKGRELQLVKTDEPTVLWSYKPDYETTRLGEAAIMPNEHLVLATVVTRSAPHKCDVSIFDKGQIVDTIITLEGKGASLAWSPAGHFAVVSTGTDCAVYQVR